MGVLVHLIGNLDGGIGQGITAQRVEGIDRQQSVGYAGHGCYLAGAIQFDTMSLTVVKGQRLDLVCAEFFECPVQTGGGILPAGQNDKRLGHALLLSLMS